MDDHTKKRVSQFLDNFIYLELLVAAGLVAIRGAKEHDLLLVIAGLLLLFLIRQAKWHYDNET